MHGLIFMTWEKYLAERFGRPFLSTYRAAIGETHTDLPLANRLYDDATLVAGVTAASELTGLPVDTLLREYGRYFILNGLTGHLCTYLLTQVHSSRDLLLMMRDAHARLRHTLEGVAPPLFTYEASSRSNEVVLIYDSPRHLCSVLRGAIEGAAERYGEQVRVIERTCMKRGAPVCRFQARFFAPSLALPEQLKTSEQVARQKARKELTALVLSLLPAVGTTGGLTLADIQGILRQREDVRPHQLRPAVLLEALTQLQFAGLVMSTASQQGDDFARRCYWHVQT
ncbi:MAG TPA: heme NO-binding domain-containing protein [Ktedonobacteraceae bacterium]|nr:heme NO-binding domain-containing protein [Ktedonobacteraceae bacterium]